MIEKKIKENSENFCILVCYFFNVKWNRSRCRSRWENLDRGQYRFRPIKFVSSVVPSTCETQPYNRGHLLHKSSWIRIISFSLRLVCIWQRSKRWKLLSPRIFPPDFFSELFFQKEFLPIPFPLEIISINIKIFLNISVQSFGGKEALVPRPAEYISGSFRFRIFYSYLMIFYKRSVFSFFSTYLTTFIEV